MKNFLLTKGWLEENINLLTDDTSITKVSVDLASKINIFNHIDLVCSKLQSGDILVQSWWTN
jgi:hypothetical protein